MINASSIHTPIVSQFPAEEDIDLSDIDLDDWDTQKDELWEPEDNFVSWETLGCGWIG